MANLQDLGGGVRVVKNMQRSRRHEDGGAAKAAPRPGARSRSSALAENHDAQLGRLAARAELIINHPLLDARGDENYLLV